MKLTSFSKGQQNFLAVLQAVSKPLPIDVVGKLAPLSDAELVSLVHHATKANWLKQTSGSHISLTPKVPASVTDALRELNTSEKISHIIDTLKEQELLNIIEPETLFNLLKKTGQKRDAGLVAYNMALEKIKHHQYRTAYNHQYNAALNLMDALGKEDINRMFFLAVLSLSDLADNYWYTDDIFQSNDFGKDPSLQDILLHAKNAAKRFGQRRQLALIRLHLARRYINLIRYKDAMDEFHKGFALLKEYDDEEIKNESMGFYGHYYFLQGKYKKAASCLEAMMAANFHREGKPDDFKAPMALCTCLSYMGHINRAIGLMGSRIRRVLSSSMPDIALSYKIILGSTLLFTDKRAEAFVHLKEALEEVNARGETYMLSRIYRSLAYYYFLEGRVHESYNYFNKGFKGSTVHQSIIMFHKAPWAIEMFFEYKRRGYEPIHGIHFETYLGNLVNGPNIHFRGIAYRVIARLANIDGEAPDKVDSFLMKSLSNLRESGDPLETAKTKALMAQVELQRSNTERARDLALQAWEGLGSLAEQFLPFELKTWITIEKPDPVKESFYTLRNYSDLLNEMLPSVNKSELINRFMIMNCRIFKSERGVLFLSSAHSQEPPELIGAYNITAPEVDDEDFKPHMDCVMKAFRTSKVVISKISENSDDSGIPHADMLCLPFNISRGISGVLYLDNRYSTSDYLHYDKPLLKEVSGNIANYVKRLIDFSGELEQYATDNMPSISKSTTSAGNRLVGKSLVIKDLLYQTDIAADTDASVIILGETGVGKELLAERIHEMSRRRERPFIDINLSSIPETLIESELFGYEKGAFTGANKQKKGYLELADQGTLFIDEIGDISHSIQVKLLRAIQEKSFFRVGGIGKISSDFRIITATNRDLKGEIDKGNFREDLYYRLNVIQLSVPPLRERGKDIILLAKHFLSRFSKRHNLPILGLSREDKDHLMSYSWPGNVRELENIIERAVILARGEKSKFKIALMLPDDAAVPMSEDSFIAPANLPLDEIQRRYITLILNQTGGRVSGPNGAAKILGINRSTLNSRMKNLGIK